MSNFLNKAKEAVTGYKDKDTGKTGYAGVAAEGQDAFKAYKTDAADGKVDWKKQATDLYGNVKGGIGGGKATEPGKAAAEQTPAEQPPPQ